MNFYCYFRFTFILSFTTYVIQSKFMSTLSCLHKKAINLLLLPCVKKNQPCVTFQVQNSISESMKGFIISCKTLCVECTDYYYYSAQWGYFIKKWMDMYEPISMVISLFFCNFVPHSLTKCEWLSELQSHSCWVLTCLDTPSSTIKYYCVQKAWHNGWMLSTNFTNK